MKKFTEREKALQKLHEDIRKDKLLKEKEEQEWIRIQTTGGGAET
mgnify:FL=1|tara:strand:+ start:42 stop:176 length:135 start_codon:yes stop_codon:yes gene_type:complete